MATALKKYDVYYTGTFTPDKYKHFECKPINIKFSNTLELDAIDAKKIVAIRKSYQKLVDKYLKKQLGEHLNKFMKQGDAKVSALMSEYTAMVKAGLPGNEAAAKKRQKIFIALIPQAIEVQKLKNDYESIFENQVQSSADQQGSNALVVCVKEVYKRVLAEKAKRVNFGQAIKVTLAVVAIGLAIAGTVLLAGAPIVVAAVLGLAIAGTAISSLATITTTAKGLKDNFNKEKKILESVKKDVKKVQEAMKPIEGASSNISRHVTTLQALIKDREARTKEMLTEIQAKNASVTSYLAQAKKIKENDENLVAEVANREKKAMGVEQQIVKLKTSMAKMAADNVKAKMLLDELDEMTGNLNELSGASANTILGNLKARFTSVDGWTDTMGKVGGTLSGASGLAG